MRLDEARAAPRTASGAVAQAKLLTVTIFGNPPQMYIIERGGNRCNISRVDSLNGFGVIGPLVWSGNLVPADDIGVAFRAAGIVGLSALVDLRSVHTNGDHRAVIAFGTWDTAFTHGANVRCGECDVSHPHVVV